MKLRAKCASQVAATSAAKAARAAALPGKSADQRRAGAANTLEIQTGPRARPTSPPNGHDAARKAATQRAAGPAVCGWVAAWCCFAAASQAAAIAQPTAMAAPCAAQHAAGLRLDTGR